MAKSSASIRGVSCPASSPPPTRCSERAATSMRCREKGAAPRNARFYRSEFDVREWSKRWNECRNKRQKPARSICRLVQDFLRREDPGAVVGVAHPGQKARRRPAPVGAARRQCPPHDEPDLAAQGQAGGGPRLGGACDCPKQGRDLRRAG